LCGAICNSSRPRSPNPLEVARRLVGAVARLLNVVFDVHHGEQHCPALVTALISLAYLQHGLLLSIALLY
jgi:hypothetical protein